MNREVLTNIGIVGAIYVVSLLLLLYTPLPSTVQLICGLLVGPTNFLFCSFDRRWWQFITCVLVVAGIVFVGVRGRAGLQASFLALMFWFGSGLYAALINGERC
jgi:hypothetical protein